LFIFTYIFDIIWLVRKYKIQRGKNMGVENNKSCTDFEKLCGEIQDKLKKYIKQEN